MSVAARVSQEMGVKLGNEVCTWRWEAAEEKCMSCSQLFRLVISELIFTVSSSPNSSLLGLR